MIYLKEFEKTSCDEAGVTSTASKEFKCKMCSKSFERRGHLLDHLNSHTGDRPYVCAFCSKGFTQKTNCRRHIVTCPLRNHVANN